MSICEVVLDDLTALSEMFTGQYRNFNARLISPLLRRLIVDNDLKRAWKEAGFAKEPTIIAPKLDEFFCNGTNLAFASHAVLPNGMEIGAFTYIEDAFFDAQLSEMAIRHGDYREYKFPLNEFGESACIYFGGTKIKRREVIQYVCNKIGGAHWDPSRDRPKDKAAYRVLDELRETGLHFGGEPVEGAHQSKTSPIAAPKNALDATSIEIVSICQSLVSSPDISALREAL